MNPRRRLLSAALPLLLLAAGLVIAQPDAAEPLPFRAGAAVVDLAPSSFPVRVNGMFTERTADAVVDPLTARALALADGRTTLVLCVVDSCMVPRGILDEAKTKASQATGVPVDRMLISATHTHSAPAAMGCLGSRMDPAYAAILPGKIAEAVIAAVKNLQPARAGWTAFDDWDHTHNRRWIRRPDKLLNDPFGQPTVRANMHPGHQSPDVTGPSGPVDPQLSMLAVESTDGNPLALLANYSMHYQGSPLLSSDYFGRFTVHIGQLLKAGPGFTAIMSQGTSGDLWSGDYSAPAKPALEYDAYAREIAERVAAAYRKIEWHTAVPLAMVETTLTLNNRIPDEARLRWAKETQQALGDQLPQAQADIYALEAIYLHESPTTEFKLQALRIGDLGITGIPNEVFCLTGLKLKARSPFPLTMNISLANGAEGYIPPPEQHALGGYTTWPARTAKLEEPAETKITAALTILLEKASGKPARSPQPVETDHAKAIMEAKPLAFWRMEQMESGAVPDAMERHPATLEPGVALYLPGHDEKPRTAPLSRAFHFAGGRMQASVPLGDAYSVAFWLWNGLPTDARPVTGYAYSRGRDGDSTAAGEHLGIGGTHLPGAQGRLILFNGNESNQLLTGKSTLALKAWHHVVLVREGTNVRVHLDGRPVPDLEGSLPLTIPPDLQQLCFGGRIDGFAHWEGKLDEIAVFPGALAPTTISQLYQTARQTPPVTALTPEFPPLGPEEALKSIHVPAGFKVELAASEPQTMDPIAIDWDPAGRLWIVEMADYPSGMDNEGRPGGRVRVLEDADGDGRYEKSTLFADGLNFPTGLLTWKDGLFVTAAPDLLYLKDTDGDGRADHTEKVITGLTEGNQQLRANGLRWGLDNRIYCAAGGHHGGHGAATVLRSHRNQTDVKTGSRDFSFDPFTGDVRPESGPSQFGRNRDDAGHWFGTQNSRALWQYVLPDPYLKRNPHVPAPDPTQFIITPLNAPVYPVSPPEKRFHSFENTGHFTSACSGLIYRDDLLFPRREHELDAFTCEPFHNLVQHNILLEDGVSHTFRRAPGEEKHDFFASSDRWCRPVMTRTGPDGALWVVDMYRYIIEHPDWLPENGRAELLPYYRLGEDKGRVYRVVPQGKSLRKAPRLDIMTLPQLAAALDSPNEWQRDKAHMMLVWKLRDLSKEEKEKMLAEVRAGLAHPNPLVRLHLLCALDGLSAGNAAAVLAGLEDPSPAVRENALRLAEALPNPAVTSRLEKMVDDPDAKVRLQLAFSLGAWMPESHPDSVQAGLTLARLAVRDHADPWMRAAVMSSAAPHCRALCEGVAAAGGPALAAYADDLATLALALEDRDSLAAMVRPALIAPDGHFTPGQLSAFTRLLTALEKKGLTRAVLTEKPDALGALMESSGAAFAFASRSLMDSNAATALRSAAAGLILLDPATQDMGVKQLTAWLAPASEQTLQVAAVRHLTAFAGPAVPGILIGHLSGFSPETRQAALEALLSREAWSLMLLDQMNSNPGLALDAVQRARLLQHSSEKVRSLATKTLSAESSRREVLEQFRPALSLKGDAPRGRQVFLNRCIACHRMEGAGIDLGPDLKSIAGHPAEKILTNIIDPSLDVQPGYFAYQARLGDGSVIYGLVTSETGNSVTFKLSDGTSRLIARQDLAELQSTGLSLMPPGLETGLSHQDMADLIAWLRTTPPLN